MQASPRNISKFEEKKNQRQLGLRYGSYITGERTELPHPFFEYPVFLLKRQSPSPLPTHTHLENNENIHMCLLTRRVN